VLGFLVSWRKKRRKKDKMIAVEGGKIARCDQKEQGKI
jgi:hypothetical protein